MSRQGEQIDTWQIEYRIASTKEKNVTMLEIHSASSALATLDGELDAAINQFKL